MVSGLQDNFETHQVVRFVIHDQDSALDHFDRLGADALEVQLCPMGADVVAFVEWDVGLRHFHGFVKFEVLLIIFLFFLEPEELVLEWRRQLGHYKTCI